MIERPTATIVYRATVEGVSSVDVRLSVLPAADGETPIECREDDIEVNIPGAANAEDVGAVQRAFGALIGIKGAVRITIEPDDEDRLQRRLDEAR